MNSAKKTIFIFKEIWKGNSVTRSFLNLRLSEDILDGDVIDVGGGSNPDYISFMEKTAAMNFLSFDVKTGAQIDFETDALPASDGKYDTVIFLNVLEHIFNYQHLVNEIVRVTKPGGKIIGFVPFLMWYHPDHKDFFRYTHEALGKIFEMAGATDFKIEPISRGPFAASAQMIISSTPNILRVPVYSIFHVLDTIFMKLRPDHCDRYALGYYFVIKPCKND